MRALGKLLQSCNDVLRIRLFIWKQIRPGMTEIVDAFEHDDVFNTRLGEHIAIEACQRAHAESDVCMCIAQHPVSSNTFVQHANAASEQPLRQKIRPAMICVFRAYRALRYLIAECN